MKQNVSTLPRTAAAAKAEFSARCARLTKFIQEGEFEQIESEHKGIPDWAGKALGSAIKSIPLTKEMVTWDDRSEAYVRGFLSAVLADIFVPLMAQVEEFAAKRAAENPSDRKLQFEREVTAKFHGKLREGFRKATGDHLLGEPKAKNDFLAGMDRWRKLRPENWRSELGNLATTPNLYLVAFWKEFAALDSIKEAHYALLCMFDGKEALAGTFETFRKRAQKFGLSYRK